MFFVIVNCVAPSPRCALGVGLYNARIKKETSEEVQLTTLKRSEPYQKT